jgi:hypothetical protein
MLKRLFGKDPEPEPEPRHDPAQTVHGFAITYPSGRTLRAVRVSPAARPETVIDALGLSVPRPVIFLMSGAGNMSSDAVRMTRSVLEDGLGRFAESRLVNVLDGGTTSGGMAIIGLARFRRGYRFPLIGVAPEALVSYPGFDNPARQAEIDAFHSHIVLTPGGHFGDESSMMIALAQIISGGAQPLLGMIVNGGEIVKREAYHCATAQTYNGKPIPLLVLEGSGRFADDLAAGRRARLAGRVHTAALQDPSIRAILDFPDLHFLPISSGGEGLRTWLERFYQNQKG